ncbi:hypothetical protein B0T18DRAFT_234824 [Schizothecium vesticola]|uniref:Uncharacterized protein n=1 Tax=Schizothecium vesticola TaxID=314040 RepID=A0AA40EFE5_9PEZI|nr:hypothetical protein B0T18DRAFT_234824 [Schizothecium vesticola]
MTRHMRLCFSAAVVRSRHTRSPLVAAGLPVNTGRLRACFGGVAALLEPTTGWTSPVYRGSTAPACLPLPHRPCRRPVQGQSVIASHLDSRRGQNCPSRMSVCARHGPRELTAGRCLLLPEPGQLSDGSIGPAIPFKGLLIVEWYSLFRRYGCVWLHTFHCRSRYTFTAGTPSRHKRHPINWAPMHRPDASARPSSMLVPR